MVIHAVFTVLLMIIPALIFNVVEKDWSIGNGIYYSFITLTTIGFGDYVAGMTQFLCLEHQVTCGLWGFTIL